MDRNNTLAAELLKMGVALRKESVDRNNFSWSLPHLAMVALRKESVDRNVGGAVLGQLAVGSLSARRAWIEIAGQPAHGLPSIGRSPQGERG